MLITIENTQQCLACFEDTDCVTACCQAPICKDCHNKWLKQKRQCMHCKEDQCDFDTWFNEYRIEPDFDPQEYLHNLLQEGTLTNNPMFPDVQQFGVQALLQVMQQALQEADTPVYMMNRTDLPPEDQPFELEYGFTMSHMDPEGNPDGPGVTVTQHMDYPGSGGDLYQQIQQSLGQYQQLFNQLQQSNGNPLPPWLQNQGTAAEQSPPPEWPWESGPPNCNQQ